MTRKLVLLRISYWLGAILDGILVIPMLFPRIGGAMFGIDHFEPGNEYGQTGSQLKGKEYSYSLFR